MEKSKNKKNLWMMFVVFGLLMLVIGYLVGSIKPFGSVAKKYSQLPSEESVEKLAGNKTGSNSDINKNGNKLSNSNNDQDKNSIKNNAENNSTPTPKPVNSDQNTSNEDSEGELTTTDFIDGYHQDFDITYPDSWSLKNESTNFSTEITLSKSNFKIRFRQADVGSSRCVYTDETDYGADINYSHFKYKNYTQFSSSSDIFRRTKWAPQDEYDLCSRDKNGVNEYNLYTKVGFISYEVPNNHTQKDLDEMDKIIQSIIIR